MTGEDSAAQRSWDDNVAGGDIPLWADLDEGSKKSWRGSLNASAYAFHDFGEELFAPINKFIDRIFGGRERESAGS